MDELSDAQVAALGETLVALKRDLLAFIGDADRDATVDLDDEIGRLSRIDALQQQQMAMAEKRRAEIRLRQVDRALAAIVDASYGDCLSCGDPVAPRRLTAAGIACDRPPSCAVPG